MLLAPWAALIQLMTSICSKPNVLWEASSVRPGGVRLVLPAFASSLLCSSPWGGGWAYSCKTTSLCCSLSPLSLPKSSRDKTGQLLVLYLLSPAPGKTRGRRGKRRGSAWHLYQERWELLSFPLFPFFRNFMEDYRGLSFILIAPILTLLITFLLGSL